MSLQKWTKIETEEAFAPYSKYLRPIRDISMNHGRPLCDIADKAYAFDEIVNDMYEHHPHSSFDAITFKDGFINFIEFKDVALRKGNGVHSGTKANDREFAGLRAKITEGVHCVEKIILQGRFISCAELPELKSRFILVYSAEKNSEAIKRYRNSAAYVKQNEFNDLMLELSFVASHQAFVSFFYNWEWEIVNQIISLDETEFVKEKGRFV